MTIQLPANLRRTARALLLAAAAAATLAGCEINAVVGSPVYLPALDGRLVPGQSTRDDIVAELGRPFGTGRAMFPFHDAPRDVLAYYYERGDLSENRRTFLWVFVEDGRYDGHMWFSSLPSA